MAKVKTRENGEMLGGKSHSAGKHRATLQSTLLRLNAPKQRRGYKSRDDWGVKIDVTAVSITVRKILRWVGNPRMKTLKSRTKERTR